MWQKIPGSLCLHNFKGGNWIPLFCHTSLHSKCYASAKGWGSKCLIHVSTRCVSLALSKFRLVRVYCKRMRSPTSLGLAGAPVWAMAFFSTCSTTLSCVAFRILTASSWVMSTMDCSFTWWVEEEEDIVSMKSAYSARSWVGLSGACCTDYIYIRRNIHLCFICFPVDYHSWISFRSSLYMYTYVLCQVCNTQLSCNKQMLLHARCQKPLYIHTSFMYI